MATRATVSPPPGVQRDARIASDVHSAGEQMHNGIAAAENRDRYANIEKRLFQVTYFSIYAARFELFSSPGALYVSSTSA
jgi:hypothetical protein